MRPLVFIISAVLAVAFLTPVSRAVDAPVVTNFTKEMLPPAVPPSAELRAAAAKLGWSAGPLVLATEPGAAWTGDGVVALITLWNKGVQKQWLVRFEIEPLTAEEKRTAKSQLSVKVSLGKGGETWDFSGPPTLALNIRSLGPYVTLPYDPKTTAKSAKDMPGRALINEEFLVLGLDRTARVSLQNKLEGKSSDANLNLPRADQKAVAGGFVSLLQFFLLATQIPGLKDIMWDVMDLPSVWSMVKGLGKIEPSFNDGSSTLAVLDPTGWGLPAERPLYRFPFGMNLSGKPSVHAAFFVIAPEPPLLTTAGIVGFTANSPSHPERRVLVQIVAGYRGTPAKPDEPTTKAVPATAEAK